MHLLAQNTSILFHTESYGKHSFGITVCYSFLGQYQYLFTFDGELKCGHQLPPVYVTIMQLNHRHFNTSSQARITLLLRILHFCSEGGQFKPHFWSLEPKLQTKYVPKILVAPVILMESWWFKAHKFREVFRIEKSLNH